MPFVPWTQQAQGAKYGEEPLPPGYQRIGGEVLPIEGYTPSTPWYANPNFWSGGLYGAYKQGGLGRILGSPEMILAGAGLPIGGFAGDISQMPGMAAKVAPTVAKGAGSWLSKMPGALATVPKWMAGHKRLTAGGIGASAITSLVVPPLLRDQYGIGAMQLPEWAKNPMTASMEAEPPTGYEAPTGVPKPGDEMGMVFWNPLTGKMEPNPSTEPIIKRYPDGSFEQFNQVTNEWTYHSPQEGVLSKEELLGEAAKSRQAPFDLTTLTAELGDKYNRQLTPEQQIAQDSANWIAQMERLKYQTSQDWASLLAQIQAQKELSTQQAAEQRQNIYAADPYKYWAQMGTPTPEAIAALTGGKVQAGQPFQATPLSYPSAQWMQGLLPSEQQQIAGGLNWMGVNPEDWFSMYQRMIPGLSARQPNIAWAR